LRLKGQQQGKGACSALTGLSGRETGSTGQHRINFKNKINMSFKELMTKYKRKGAT